MAYLTQDKIREIINNSPAGTTPEGIIAGLIKKGHTLEGYKESKVARLTRLKESLKEEREREFKVPAVSVGSYLSSMGGLFLRGLQWPQAAYTTYGKGLGGVIGGLSMRTPEGMKIAKEELEKTKREMKAIPEKVIFGEKEKYAPAGILAPSGMPTPSEALGLKGIAGFAVNVLGDPINLLVLVLKGGSQADDVLKAGKQGKGKLEKFADRIYQKILKPRTAKEAKQYKQLGKTFEGIIKEDVDTLGSRLSKYGVKGSAKGMIGEINQKIPKLGQQLDEAAKVADDAGKTIDITDTIKKLDDYANKLESIGDTKAAEAIKETIRGVEEYGKEIPVNRAIELKRLFDWTRQTAKGGLSESRAIRNQVYKILGDGLRDKINKVPTVGTINAELSTYYDALDELVREAVRIEKYGTFPVNLSSFFPWIRPNWSFIAGPVAAIETTLAQIAIKFGKSTLEIRRILTPSVLRNLLKELEK